jgi:hypothetical protein
MPRGPALSSRNPKVVKIPVVIEMKEKASAKDSKDPRVLANRWR